MSKNSSHIFKEHIDKQPNESCIIRQHKNNGWEISIIQTILKWFLEYLISFLYWDYKSRNIPTDMLISGGMFFYFL